MYGDTQTPAATSSLLEQASSDPLADPEPAGVTSVLILDDRTDVRQELSLTLGQILSTPAPVDIRVVDDGIALLESFETRPAGLLLIGIHAGSTAGSDGLDLLLATHPSAATIVYGALADIDVLAAAYALGAGGMLLWESQSSVAPSHP